MEHFEGTVFVAHSVVHFVEKAENNDEVAAELRFDRKWETERFLHTDRGGIA